MKANFLIIAVRVPSVYHVITKKCFVMTARYLQSDILTHFILKRTTIKGTLLDWLVGAAMDPLDLISDNSQSRRPVCETVGEDDGLVKFLQFLLLH